MEILAIILAGTFFGCLYCCGWGVLHFKRAYDVKVDSRRSQVCLWCGFALFLVGGLGAVYTGKGFYSIVFDASEIKSIVSGNDGVARNDSDDGLVATNASGCVLDWGDLRVRGNYGSITVANRSKAVVAITVSANGVSLQAKLEPNRGVRLRNGLKLPERDETVWTVALANGEKRQFSFEQCMPFGCDIPPAAQKIME